LRRDMTRNVRAGNLRDNSQLGHATAAKHLPRDSSESRCHVLTTRSKIMNTSSTSPTTPNLELLRKAIREYQPDPSRIPFSNLKPFHDSIVELRGKNASYAAIAELLEQHGVKTSRARVAEYGRIVLEGGKSRKRREAGKNHASRKISRPRLKVRQPWPQNPRRQHRSRAMSRRPQKKIRHTVHADRTLPT